MKTIFITAFLMVVALPCHAQPGPVFQTTNTAYVGAACASNVAYLLGPTGRILTCQNGVLVDVSGTQIAPFSVCGSAGCVLNETANWTYAVMVAGTIKSCGVVATTAPTGSAIIVDILLNGTSIFGANPKTTVAISSTNYAAVSVFASTAVVVGDKLTAKVTQVDSNGVGQFVRVGCTIQ